MEGENYEENCLYDEMRKHAFLISFFYSQQDYIIRRFYESLLKKTRDDV